ncbi:hypothetical protein [Kordiimonas sp.]|uniref:hypothetical protein n=1 Tax=Kordiimonas sp. TaxID=1970157 RepID=UPI003A8DD3A8
MDGALKAKPCPWCNVPVSVTVDKSERKRHVTVGCQNYDCCVNAYIDGLVGISDTGTGSESELEFVTVVASADGVETAVAELAESLVDKWNAMHEPASVYPDIQTALDSIDPELGEDFRKRRRNAWHRLRRWWWIRRAVKRSLKGGSQ